MIAECLNLGLSVSQIETKVARMKQAEKLMKIKDFIDSKGAYAVTDRQELTDRNLGVEHGQVPIEFINNDELAAKIVRDEVYYLNINFKDEVLIYYTYEMEEKGKDDSRDQAKAEAKERERLAKELIKIRRAALMEAVNTVSLPKSEIEEMLDQVLVRTMNAAVAKFVTILLGVNKDDIPKMAYSTPEAVSYDYNKAILTLLQAGGKRASRCRLAIIIGSEEVFAQTKPSERYIGVLNRIGFDVTDDGKLVMTETGEVVDGHGN